MLFRAPLFSSRVNPTNDLLSFSLGTGVPYGVDLNNVRPYIALLVENLNEDETMQRIEWPTWFSDLNRIDYVWDTFRRRITTRPMPPVTLQDLEIALRQECNSIP
ncbi:hypothetical protein TNCV_2856641 [Trichonephila clavipes]|nr:hypothetical protein TNCV_2856641 [Trichonephila clavipes]